MNAMEKYWDSYYTAQERNLAAEKKLVNDILPNIIKEFKKTTDIQKAANSIKYISTRIDEIEKAKQINSSIWHDIENDRLQEATFIILD